MRVLATIVVLALLLGCGGLVANKNDSSATKAAKVTARTVLGVGTLGISELHVAKAKREKDFEEYLETLPPEEREFEKLLHSLVSDESRRSYLRSLPPEQRTQAITQLIIEKERQEADASTAARSAILQGIMSQPSSSQSPSPSCYGTSGVLGCAH